MGKKTSQRIKRQGEGKPFKKAGEQWERWEHFSKPLVQPGFPLFPLLFI